MARNIRYWYPNSLMHITCRGNRKEIIFKERSDYKRYLKLLKECIECYEDEFEILSYVLMTNHIHLQIKTKNTHIGDFMQKLNNAYAKYFNKKYSYVGHLFQGRYKSNIIDNDIYFIETSRYIHLNPVRARIVDDPKEYEWSSFPMYVGNKKEELINSKIILDYFKLKVPLKSSRDMYREYVESGIE